MGHAEQVLATIGDGKDLGQRFDVHEDVVISLVEEFESTAQISINVIDALT